MTVSDLSLLLAAPALELGVAAAQMAGPMRWNWPDRVGPILQRLRSLPRGERSVGRRMLGAGLVAALLAGGTLAAYAAEPAAPRRAMTAAPAPVERADSPRPTPVRTLLASVPAKPAVAPTAPATPPALTLAGVPDEATAQRIIQAYEAYKTGTGWAFVPYHPVSVSDAEARRLLAYVSVGDLARARGAAAPATPDAMKALWSDAGYDDYLAINAKLGAAANAARASGQTVASVSYLPDRVAVSPAFRTSVPLPPPGTVIPPRPQDLP